MVYQGFADVDAESGRGGGRGVGGREGRAEGPGPIAQRERLRQVPRR